jgi:sigma-E factor negative regulatory protein RseC
VLKASFLVYILPVLGLVIGSVIGQRYSTEIWAGGDPETVSVLTGLFFLAVSFLSIRVFNSRFGASQKYYPVIEKVLDRSHGDPLENPQM